jgi:hypothetical protein
MIFDICKKIEDAAGRSGGHCGPEPFVLSSAGLANFEPHEDRITLTTRPRGRTSVYIYRHRSGGLNYLELGRLAVY